MPIYVPNNTNSAWTTWATTLVDTSTITTTSASSTWTHWVATASNSTSNAITITLDDTWSEWCQTDSTDASTVWYTWTRADLPTTRAQVGPTKEQIAEQKRRAEENKKAAEEKRLQREAATKKARELLERHLNDEQLDCLKKKKHFFVNSQTGRRYRIMDHSPSGNIELCGAGDKAVRRYCAHPASNEGSLPMGDVMLAQMLQLRIDEAGFLKVANVHWTDEALRSSIHEEDQRLLAAARN